jgi:TonB family protein
MNQKICSNCKNPNNADQSFCASCGQPLYSSEPPPTMFAGSPGVPGFTPNQPSTGKKSRLGLWLAIIGGVGLLGILIVGVGLVGVYYFLRTRQPEINYNSYPANLNQNSLPTNNSNTNSTISTSMSEDEKYRLFYAASKAGEQPLTMKVSKKIGIIDENNKPTEYYKTFLAGMFKWAARDTEFVKKIDTKQKAVDYINSQIPSGSTSTNPEVSSTSNNVSGGVLNGKATNLVKPPYPATAKAVRASGAVNVQVTVDEEGNVINASAISGHPLLRQSAEQAARASKFSPTMLNGKAVKVSGIIVYNFTAE